MSKKREEEERRNLTEIEKFERKMGKRGPKRQKRTSEAVEEQPRSNTTKVILLAVSVLLGLVAVAAAYQLYAVV